MAHSNHTQLPEAAADAATTLLGWVVHRIARELAERCAAIIREMLAGPRWLTAEEAAAHTRLPLGTFQKRAAAQKFRRVRHGKLWLYRTDWLDAELVSGADELTQPSA